MNSPVIGLYAGSTRTLSLNRKLVFAMANLFQAAGAQTDIIDLADYGMPIYNGDYEDAHGIPDATKSFIERLLSCQGVFIATPEYNGGLPALLKNTIDWSSRIGLDHFNTPVYGIGAATPGALSGIMALRELRFILARLGAEVVPTQLGVGRAVNAFTESGHFVEGQTKHMAQTLVSQMLAAL